MSQIVVIMFIVETKGRSHWHWHVT